VTIARVTQALGPDGWQDAQTVDLTAFCGPGCQADWLAAHPGAVDSVPLGPGRRRASQPGQWLDETDYDVWCAACGVLVQTGLSEAPCPTWACPPVVVNRLASASGGALRRLGLAAAPRPPPRPAGSAPVSPARCRHELHLAACAWCAPPSPPVVRPMAVVAAWYPTLCRRCGRRSDVGDPVGLVARHGPCCATCCGLPQPHPDRRGRHAAAAPPQKGAFPWPSRN
jgi:hypothetical protein